MLSAVYLSVRWVGFACRRTGSRSADSTRTQLAGSELRFRLTAVADQLTVRRLSIGFLPATRESPSVAGWMRG